MSASNKKKLRKEQEAEKLTEKQLSAQKEAKKTDRITYGFIALMAVILVTALIMGVSQLVRNSGVLERKTVALTVGEHEISNAELGYFYMDAVNTFTSQYGSYAAMFGLDLSMPLDQQVQNPETGETWADNFLASARENAKDTYALVDAANEEGFTLTEDQLAEIDTTILNLEAYAKIYGYSDANRYIKAIYGSGATVDSYKAYVTHNTMASAYYDAHSESLTYTDEDIRAKDAEDPKAYSSYSYNTYYLSASNFLEGGTEDENGNKTYSDEEKQASVDAAKAAADSILEGKPTTVAELDACIAALPERENQSTASQAYADTLYSSVSSVYADWVTDEARKEGDVTVIANTSTTTNEDGTEETVTNGYYVVFYTGMSDNQFSLKNVRHILVPFQGGTQDAATGATTYSDEEKAAAKTSAEDILKEFESGDKTEDSFAALAKEKSTDPGSKDNGGLYENVYPGQMVTAFNDWCFDETRAAGDTGIVETEYGYHVMYFVGDADITYRDYLITNDLRTAEVEKWYTDLVDAMPMELGDDRYVIRKNYIVRQS